MDILSFLVAALACFAFVQFYWIPILRSELRIDRTTTVIGTFALLALLLVLRTVIFMIICSTTALVVTAIGLNWYGGTSEIAVNAALEKLRWLHERINQINSVWGLLSSAFLILVITILAHRRGRAVATAGYIAAFEEQYSQYRALYDEGSLQPKHDDWYLTRLNSEIKRRKDEVIELEIQMQCAPNSGQTSKLERLRREIMQRQLIFRDEVIKQHVDIRLDMLQVALPRAVTGTERLQDVLISKGLVRLFQGISRLFFLTSLILLVPSLLTAASAPLERLVYKRSLALSGATVSAAIREVNTDIELRRNREPTYELSDDDRKVIEEAASHISLEVARSFVSSSASQYFEQELTHLRAVVSIDTATSGTDSSGPPKTVYQTVADDLAAEVRRDPSAIQHLREYLDLVRPMRPAAEDDVARQLVFRIIGGAADGAIDAELATYLNHALAGSDPHLLVEMHNSQARRFIVKLLGGGGHEAAVASMQFTPEQRHMQAVFSSLLDARRSDVVRNVLGSGAWRAMGRPPRIPQSAADDFGRKGGSFMDEIIEALIRGFF